MKIQLGSTKQKPFRSSFALIYTREKEKRPPIRQYFRQIITSNKNGCRQNLDPPSGPPPSGPPSGPLNFFSEKKINLSYTQCVCYMPLLLSQFSFLQFSVQLERRCSPLCHTFPSPRLVLTRGNQELFSDHLLG